MSKPLGSILPRTVPGPWRACLTTSPPWADTDRTAVLVMAALPSPPTGDPLPKMQVSRHQALTPPDRTPAGGVAEERGHHRPHPGHQLPAHHRPQPHHPSGPPVRHGQLHLCGQEHRSQAPEHHGHRHRLRYGPTGGSLARGTGEPGPSAHLPASYPGGQQDPGGQLGG